MLMRGEDLAPGDEIETDFKRPAWVVCVIGESVCVLMPRGGFEIVTAWGVFQALHLGARDISQGMIDHGRLLIERDAAIRVASRVEGRR